MKIKDKNFLIVGMKKETNGNGSISLMILQIKTAKLEISAWSSMESKIDAGLPIFNYAVGYDLNNSEPSDVRKISRKYQRYFSTAVYD